MKTQWYLAIMMSLVWHCAVQNARSCPFCAPAALTFSEEIGAADVAVIATLKQLPPPAETEATSTLGFNDSSSSKAQFEVIELLKGNQHLEKQSQAQLLEVDYVGEDKVGDKFLLIGLDPPELNWTIPIKVSDRIQVYLAKVMQLPEDASQRLVFFKDYLEDEEEMLARDSYDEFAKTPYKQIKTLKDQMDRQQLVAWIRDTELPTTRRRLYLTLLGVCGAREDADLLEGMLRSDDRRIKAAMDAMIGCYLSLVGTEGLPLIEELLLTNKDAEYTHIYGAIVALRFHASQADKIPRERVVQSLRLILLRPDLADLVIPDLAKFEDWTVVPQLVKLFKDSTDENSWVRVPVINFLRRCPLPEAKTHLEELSKLDPESYRRAQAFSPTEDKKTEPEAATEARATESQGIGQESVGEVKITTVEEGKKDNVEPTSEENRTGVSEVARSEPLASYTPESDFLMTDSGPDGGTSAPGVATVLGIQFLASAILLGVYWMILRRA